MEASGRTDPAEQKFVPPGVLVNDLAFILLTLAVFGLLSLLAKGAERL